MLAYNRANYIREAIDSALAQTHSNFELIIIDDGSTDNTADIIASYRDPRLSYHCHLENRGLYERRRESLAYAKGEYVAILDSDDIWNDASKLEKQIAYMEAHRDCAVVGTFILLIDHNGKEFGRNTYHTTDTNIRRSLLIRNQFANSSVLIRKSHLDKTAGYRDFAPCEDLELFLQLGAFGTFANLPEYTTSYRIHQGGESARKVRVAKQVLRLAKLHKQNYRGYWRSVLKMNLLLLLAKLKIK